MWTVRTRVCVCVLTRSSRTGVLVCVGACDGMVFSVVAYDEGFSRRSKVAVFIPDNPGSASPAAEVACFNTRKPRYKPGYLRGRD